MNNSLVSWSGGKDSCYAAMKAKEQGFDLKILLNVLNEEGQVSRSHGIPLSILQAQAYSANLLLHTFASSWNDYEAKFIQALNHCKKSHGITHAIFGDIDLDEHKAWEEKVCSIAGVKAILPLWKEDRKSLVLQMLDSGIEAVIVSCNEKMGSAFLGKTLNRNIIEELEALGIDPCGEGGEFHTLVVQSPLFTSRINISIEQTQLINQYWFCQLKLEN